MGIFRRRATQQDPDHHVVGVELGLGIVGPDHAVPRPSTESRGVDCGSCGAKGRIDMIDMTIRRAYLTCPKCGRTWDTDRASVPAQPFFPSRV